MSAVALHYEEAGAPDAPALVLAGSLGTTLHMWQPQIGPLSERLRVVALDHRGHGRSPVPEGPYTIAEMGGDVLALMDRLGLQRAAFCGLSIGGMVGQWLGINAPERVTRLILICTSGYLPPAESWRERAAAVRAAGTPAVVADAVVGRWFTPDWARGHADVVARHREMISATEAEGYASCCEAIAELDLRAGLASVRAPTLVLVGAQDPSISPAHGEAIAAAVPGARLVALDPAAHLASVERADEVTALITEHLEVKL